MSVGFSSTSLLSGQEFAGVGDLCPVSSCAGGQGQLRGLRESFLIKFLEGHSRNLTVYISWKGRLFVQRCFAKLGTSGVMVVWWF